jgi:RNA polymerase sigma-70 factor (ECF subfamily)
LDSEEWIEVVRGYQPLINKWVMRFDSARNEVADITQDVLITVVRELPKFEHNGRTGAFRNWLRTITINKIRANWKKKNRLPIAQGQEMEQVLNQFADPKGELAERWNQEHDHHLFGQLLEKVRSEFNSKTMEVFQRFVLDGEDSKSIAADMGISANQIYKFKHRVIERMKLESQTLLSVGFDLVIDPVMEQLDHKKIA